jgi:hypothetical protein
LTAISVFSAATVCTEEQSNLRSPSVPGLWSMHVIDLVIMVGWAVF